MLSRSTLALTIALPLLYSIHPVEAFWVTRSTYLLCNDFARFCRHHEARHRIERYKVILRESSSDNSPDHDIDEGTLNEKRLRKRLTAVRVGGRRVKQKQQSPTKQLPPPMEIQRFLLPSLIGLLLVSWTLGGGTESKTFYYSYSSYSFETSTYNKDGVVDVKRQESANFRSNIPGLRNNPPMLNDLRQENQRLLERQEQEYLDAFSSNMIRTIEDIFDESWE